MDSIKIVIGTVSLRQIVLSLIDSSATVESHGLALMVVELNGEADCAVAVQVRQMRSIHPALPVVAISGQDNTTITQQAVRMGIDDFFCLPRESADFRRALSALLSGNQTPSKSSQPQSILLGDSLLMEGLRKFVARVALTDSSVMITGETGTGKELVAELIHKSGSRRDKPFVCVNSAALPDSLVESELFGFEKGAFTGANAKYQGKLQMAHGGTIFFDEIGELSLAAQAKVLRAIESREVFPLGGWRGVTVDIRLIAATNRDLEAGIQSGQFRRDLFYRLNVVRIELPPLRERREDIPQLLQHFLGFYNRQLNRRVESFDPYAVELLKTYRWPGNIRELKNVVEASFVHAESERIEVVDLPDRLQRAFKDQMPPDSREKLVHALFDLEWNISRVADELRCSRMTVYRKMAQYSISRSSDRPRTLTAKA